MNLPIQTDRLIEEMSQLQKILEEVKDRVESKINLPMNDVSMEIFQVQLKTELQLLGHRFAILAELISEI
jgi:hypothetical protein